jgi:NAD(P)-dependent dehydrogenase (short-subunit alcohol dehydrogenase family)
MTGSLEGRAAVVTGGGRGIGAAIARGLAAAGARVVVSGRTPEVLEQVVRDIRGAGGVADAVPCDVARTDDVARLGAETRRLVGRPSIILANAGIATSAKLRDTSDDIWHQTIEVNLGGAFRIAREFHGDLVAAARHGRLIFIGSTASRIGFPYASAYAASKHGLLGLCRSHALELAPTGVTVNCVCPGWTDTGMAQRAVDRIAARTGRAPAEARGELERMSPQRRLMTVDEVAAVALFLASDAAGGVTGQAWNVDGGQVMA